MAPLKFPIDICIGNVVIFVTFTFFFIYNSMPHLLETVKNVSDEELAKIVTR